MSLLYVYDLPLFFFWLYHCFVYLNPVSVFPFVLLGFILIVRPFLIHSPLVVFWPLVNLLASPTVGVLCFSP